MNFKKTAAIICAALTMSMALFAGCSGKSAAPADKITIEKDGKTMISFSPTENNVKFLGRTEVTDDGLWLAYSGSGAEFSFKGNSLEITISGDDKIESEDFDSLPRIAVFVDGERAIDKVLSREESISVISSDATKSSVVRVVKLSETGNSTCAIKSILTDADGEITPTESKSHSIEFIGDSITCGYGVDAADQSKPFSTRTEDCTKAYAYLTAELLDADYSLVSKSGHGIISGYTGDGNKATWGIMPDYYESFGSGSGSLGGVSPDSVKWDFKNNTYDAVVINLGTNDYSYTGRDASKCNEYKDGYIKFLKRVRKLNPNSKIICALGIMGDELYPTIEAAVDEYKAETGDTNITTYHFDPQNGANGYGADWHPSAVTHEMAADKFAEFVKTEMGW